MSTSINKSVQPVNYNDSTDIIDPIGSTFVVEIDSVVEPVIGWGDYTHLIAYAGFDDSGYALAKLSNSEVNSLPVFDHAEYVERMLGI